VTITFWFSLLSPWVYFAGPRLHAIAARHGARIDYRPIDLLRVFRETGGTPLAQLSPARREHRRLERARWSAFLGMPISAQPRHHPVPERGAACCVMAAADAGHAPWPLAQALLEAVWRRDLDISDRDTVATIAAESGLDAVAMRTAFDDPALGARFDAQTEAAMAAGIFGVPSFVVNGEMFFGQDRLDFVDRALAAAPRDEGRQ
jgi:2-hydroxychromene-2-carboxylate isomerase